MYTLKTLLHLISVVAVVLQLLLYIKIAPRSIASATYAVNHKGNF